MSFIGIVSIINCNKDNPSKYKDSEFLEYSLSDIELELEFDPQPKKYEWP